MRRYRQLLLLTTALLVGANAWAAPTDKAYKRTSLLEADTLKVVDVEEVTVIATPKENRKLRELPAAVTLLSRQELRNAQVSTIKHLTSVIPNLFIPDYGSRLTSAVYIRGIGSRINTPSVGLYVDNIPYIDKSAFDFSYADVERIDVLRGPQGTLYGRNAMGGLIKIHTKSPFSYQGTDLRMGAATRNTYNASLTHYHRLSERLAFSAGGFYDYQGGFFRNATRNEKADKGQAAGGRIRTIFLPSDNWKLDLNLNYEYSDQGGYPYFYQGEISNNAENSYYRNLLNVGLNAEHQARHFTLSIVTGYQHLKDRMAIDQDFTAADIYTLEQRQRSNTFSEEIVLKNRPGRRWQWTTGVFGFYQALKTKAPVTFREAGMQMLDRMLGSVIPSHIQVPMGPGMNMNILPSLRVTDRQMLIGGRFDTPLVNGALFHQSTFRDLFGLKGVSATLGLRLDYERMKLHYDSGTRLGYTVGIRGEMRQEDAVIREIEMMPETALSVESRYHGGLNKEYLQLLPKIALQYDFARNAGNLYATVSKGYRSGGYNVQMFSDLLQSSLRNDMMRQSKEEILKHVPENFKPMFEQYFPDAGENPDAKSAILYKPEQTWSYEVGTHLNLLDGRLRADAALFWLETRDQQLSRFAANGLGRETINAGKSRSRGAEIALTATLTSALTLNASYGYTHATFKEYATNEKVNGEIVEISYNGKRVPFVPKHTLNVGGQYAFHLRPAQWLDRILLSANYSGAGRIYWTERNDVSQAFYGTLNGRISLQKGKGEIDFWIRNALDKDYATFYFESMGNGFTQKGKAVQAGVEVRCRF